MTAAATSPNMSALEKRRSRVAALNGVALTAFDAPLEPSRPISGGGGATPLVVEAVSYAFAVFPAANAAACR